jgi:hypothetical protein
MNKKKTNTKSEGFILDDEFKSPYLNVKVDKKLLKKKGKAKEKAKAKGK